MLCTAKLGESHSSPDTWMTELKQQQARVGVSNAAFSRQNALSWLVLGIGVLATLFIWSYLVDREERAAHREFVLITDDITSAIHKRMIDHEQILLGGAGLGIFWCGSHCSPHRCCTICGAISRRESNT